MNSTSKSIPKGKPTRKQRKVQRQSRNLAMSASAPVAVSQDLRQFTYFRPAKKATGLRMHTCAPIAQIARAPNNLSNYSGLWLAGTTGGQALQLSLTNPTIRNNATVYTGNLISPVFDLIASSFARYRVNSLKFHYEPQAAATTGERLVFAFARDPEHPLVWSATSSQSNLLALSDSVAFMPWKGWSLDVSSELDDTLYYTYDGTNSGTDSRFSNFASIACISDTQNASASESLYGGILYMEIEIEFVEFCPISVTRPAMQRALISRFQPSPVVVSSPKDDEDMMLKKALQTYQVISGRLP